MGGGGLGWTWWVLGDWDRDVDETPRRLKLRKAQTSSNSPPVPCARGDRPSSLYLVWEWSSNGRGTSSSACNNESVDVDERCIANMCRPTMGTFERQHSSSQRDN